MAAQSGGPALLNMPRNLMLLGAEAVRAPVLIEVAAEDFGHLGPLFSRNSLNRF
jgi:hypothetical protein